MNRLLLLAFVFGCASALPAADRSCNCGKSIYTSITLKKNGYFD